MKCLSSMVGVIRMNRARNEEVLRRAGMVIKLASRVDECLRINLNHFRCAGLGTRKE